MTACLLDPFTCSLVYAPDRLVGNVDGVGRCNHVAKIQDDESAPCSHDVGNDARRITKETALRLFGCTLQKPFFLVLLGAKLLDAAVKGIGKIAEFLGRQVRSPVSQFALFRNELVLDPLVFRNQLPGLALDLGQRKRTRPRLLQQSIPINCQDRRGNLGGSGIRKQARAHDEARKKQPRSAWKS